VELGDQGNEKNLITNSEISVKTSDILKHPMRSLPALLEFTNHIFDHIECLNFELQVLDHIFFHENL
jgi:hypothetical protein